MWRSFVVLALAWLLPALARAEVDIAVPAGWTLAADGGEATNRAAGWAAEGLAVRSVMTPIGDDDFAETLAVLVVPRPLEAEILRDPEAGRAHLASVGRRLFGVQAEPEDFERVAVASGTSLLRARWTTDELVLRLALVPSGPTHAAIALAVDRRTDVLYADVFDATLAELRGASPPLHPFPHDAWRWTAGLVWIAIGAGAALVVARTAVPTPGPAVAGRRAAALLFGLAVLAAVGAYAATAGREPELALVRLSRPWLAVEVALGGLVAAASILAATVLWDRRLGVIESAPSGGTFAPRATTPPDSRTADVRTADVPVSDAFPAPGVPARRIAHDDDPTAELEHVLPRDS